MRPDKLRFDFTHGQRLSPAELQGVEDDVNTWILENHPVRAISTTLDEARALGAMALFGEKYGDVVRMVEVGDGSFSRELCGGTHVRSTAEIGVIKITSEGSSASNVRRVEAVTGPAAVTLLREHDGLLRAGADALRTTPDQVPDAIAGLQAKAKAAAKAQSSGAANGAPDPASIAAGARDVGGAMVLTATVDGVPGKALMDVADRVKGQVSGDAAIVLGSAVDGKVVPGRVRRPVARRARGQGRRGHQDRSRCHRRRRRRARHDGPGRRQGPGQARRGPRRGPCSDRVGAHLVIGGRVLALDYGSARCGCAVSDPTGTIVTPIDPVLRPGTRKGFNRVLGVVRERGVKRVVVGLPVTLRGTDSAQTTEVREFAAKLTDAVRVPVEMYDERFTTSIAAQRGGSSSEDSRAAAVLLEDWLTLNTARDHAEVTS